MINDKVREALEAQGWFQGAGAYTLVDGQYGSTGKGLMAAALAEFDLSERRVDTVTTNAGPNSGHTAIMDDGTEIMTQQVPVFSAVQAYYGSERQVVTYLNGGAVIDIAQVNKEVEKYGLAHVVVHPHAAVICDEVIEAFNSGSMDAIASTGKGVGQAMASKVLRQPFVVENKSAELDIDVEIQRVENYGVEEVIFVETAQGFSLGINQGFYPYTTSRECTVSQALADAGIPPTKAQNTIMTLRTFPIRVGNTTIGRSGPGYEDQMETTWEQIGQTPELTTVTKRVRRIFTWSWEQYRAALRANAPDTLFLNFAQYLTREGVSELLDQMLSEYAMTLNTDVEPLVLLGFGPRTSDIYTVAQWEQGETPHG